MKKIINPFQINNWVIKKFLSVILSIQLAMWGIIWLNSMGLEIPILRQLIGFIYLTFVPGILILRTLKLHKLGNIKTLLYTVGLSIATLMFTGLFMNSVYPLFGISGPISLTPLVTTISGIVLVLCILSYVRDKDFAEPSFIDVKDMLSPPALFLCIIPFLAIFGTYLMNFHHNNILQMFLIIILVLIVILISFNKFITKDLYPLAVFIIAISLVYHSSLITMYLWGRDIHIECYLSNLVIWNSCWDPALLMQYNAMLSVVMLSPIFSNICAMNTQWVFKIIYPFLLSLVPLGLYRVFQEQTDEKNAFMACFFFMSVVTFYTDILQVAKQQIAELFFVLMILLLIDKNLNKTKRSLLFIIFGFSLVVSHYGVCYIFMFCLIAAWLILTSCENLGIQIWINNVQSKFGVNGKKPVGNPITLNAEDRTISSTFVLLFVVFTLTWYMYTCGSSTFNAIATIGGHMRDNIFELFDPEKVQALYIITGRPLSRVHSVTKYFHLIMQFFISAGILAVLLKRSEMKFEREFFVFSLTFFAICLICLALPYSSRTMGISRVYHICLFFLAPFCIIGGITIFKMMNRAVRVPWTSRSTRRSFKILGVFFAIFLLFNTGFVYEIAKDDPTPISLNTDIKHPRFHFGNQEAYAAQWLASVGEKESVIYAGDFGRFLLYDYVHNKNKVRVFVNDTRKVPPYSYIFMGLLNIREDEVVILETAVTGAFREYLELSTSTFYKNIINKANKVCDNGDAQIYYFI